MDELEVMDPAVSNRPRFFGSRGVPEMHPRTVWTPKVVKIRESGKKSHNFRPLSMGGEIWRRHSKVALALVPAIPACCCSTIL